MRALCFGLRSALALALLAAGASGAAGETVHTRDGQRFVGEIVDEAPDGVVLRTAYGLLVIPADAVEEIEGRDEPARGSAEAAPTEAAPEPGPDLAKLRILHLKARRLRQLGRHEQALAGYAEILALRADDATALYGTACVQGALGRLDEALAALERAVLAGFADLERVRGDADLATLRADERFGAFIARWGELVRRAAAEAPARIGRLLAERGAVARYRVKRDEKRGLVILHTLDAVALGAAHAQLAALVDGLRRSVFRQAPLGPLFVVLLAEEDGTMLPRGSRAIIEPDTQAVLLGALPPGGQLARAHAAQNAIIRALHGADRAARGARHPDWLAAGLASLFEASRRDGDRLVPRPRAALGALKQGIGQLVPWPRLFAMNARALDLQGPLATAQLRSLLRYVEEKGKLGALCDALSEKDGAGRPAPEKAFDAAMGTSFDEVVTAWKAWLLAQDVPAVPFAGILTNDARDGLRVTYVQGDGGAAKAGLSSGDIIVAVDGTPVTDEADLDDILSTRAVGDEVELRVARGEASLRATVRLAERPKGPIGPPRAAAPYAGASVEALADGSGIAIREVDAGSPAALAGLQPGDRLTSFDGAPVESVRGWLRALRAKAPGDVCALVVRRAGASVTIEVTLAELPE